jgi:AraC-like DNA-binding protein
MRRPRRCAFTHDFGVTIRSYHINVRVLEAVKLLPDRRFDGRSLAAAVGYRSHKNFYRAVRTVTGLSLSELRKIPHAEALERARLPKPCEFPRPPLS